MSEKPDFEPVHRTPRWVGEYDVIEAMKRVLMEVVEERGNSAKAFAWDVNFKFRKAIEELAA